MLMMTYLAYAPNGNFSDLDKQGIYKENPNNPEPFHTSADNCERDCLLLP